ncbi:MAG: non-canonical purine NTP pyrophosphatase, partial [Athalassotoga sp.]
MKVILSTSNPNKVREIFEIIDLDIEWVVKKIEVEEDGETFEENAIKKAKAAYDLYGPAVADDSGLEIYALDNFPGVKSARFMEGVDYSVKNAKILEMMKDMKADERGARFSCVAVYYDQKPH